VQGEGGSTSSRISRREALKKGALLTGMAWTTPVIVSQTPAFAQVSPGPCFFTCTYKVWFDYPSLGCVEPRRCDTCNGCSQCEEPSCSRITSVQSLPDGGVRFCADCELFADPDLGGCWHCTDYLHYEGNRHWAKDPADGRCATVAPPDTSECKPDVLEVAFDLCHDCRPL
jgi:hypothetical protein